MVAGGQQGIRAGRAFVELGLHDKLRAGLRRASRRLRAFGTAVSGIGRRLALAGMAGAAAFGLAAKRFAGYGDQVAKMSKRTGVSVEALSELNFVASQTGTEFATLENAFRKMQRSIYDAGRGLSTAVDALADLGLEFQDLDGLAPEEQFKKIGDRISQLTDPTRKAAIAMSLMGRTGTNLLPMFAEGARGIEALQKKARRLGLTMSAEDAKAAEDLTDAFDVLWRTVKMGVFHIGAALAPALTGFGERAAEVMAKVSAWIKSNRGLVLSIAKITLGVLAAGAALMVLGPIISGLGFIVGGLGVALGLAKVALLALLSPMGLVLVAVAGLGAYTVYATGTMGKATGWLAEKFGDLKDDALTAFAGISAALASGNVGLAAKVMWLSLKLAWERGISWLKGLWHQFWGGLRLLAEVGIHTIVTAWIEGVYAIRKAWTHVTGFFSDTWTTMKMIAGEGVAEIKGLLDDTYDVEAQINKVRLAGAKGFSKTELARRKALAAANREHNAQAAAEEKRHTTRLGEIQTENRARIDAAKAAVAVARKEWLLAVKAAGAGGRRRGDTGGPGGLLDPSQIIDDVKRAAGGAAAGLARAAESVVGGTFGADIRGLFAGGAAERTAAASERVAANTDKLVRLEKQKKGATFD